MRSSFSYMQYPGNYHLCFLPAETSPKPPDLLVCKAKPSQMNILGLENVSFSFGGLSHGHIAVCHFLALRVLRQEGTSWQLWERGPSALWSSVTELLWIQLVLMRGLTISYTVKLTINQPSHLPGTSMIPVCLYYGKKIPQWEALGTRIICILNSNNLFHFLFHFWLADVSVF